MALYCTISGAMIKAKEAMIAPFQGFTGLIYGFTRTLPGLCYDCGVTVIWLKEGGEMDVPTGNTGGGYQEAGL